MFEARRPLRTAHAMPVSGGDGAGAMHELSWSDLVARMAASRDFRTIIANSEGDGDASFDSGSARWIAQHRSAALPNGDFGINPEASANGKWGGGKTVPTHGDNDAQAHTGAPRN